jgi:protein-histidine pros-kinase
MLIKDAKCLACHDTPDTAPRTLVERYGNANGFGWKLNDILTAQIVSAPMELPMARADHVSRIIPDIHGLLGRSVFAYISGCECHADLSRRLPCEALIEDR